MAKVRVTAEQWANNWSTAVQSDSEKVRQGVNNVTESPCVAAANRKDAYLAGINRAAGRWEANLRKVTVEDWKRRYLEKGVSNRAAAVATATPAVQSHATKAIPIINNLLSTMPPRAATLDGNLQRVKHVAAGMQKAFGTA